MQFYSFDNPGAIQSFQALWSAEADTDIFFTGFAAQLSQPNDVSKIFIVGCRTAFLSCTK